MVKWNDEDKQTCNEKTDELRSMSICEKDDMEKTIKLL